MLKRLIIFVTKAHSNALCLLLDFHLASETKECCIIRIYVNHNSIQTDGLDEPKGGKRREDKEDKLIGIILLYSTTNAMQLQAKEQ